MHPDDLKTMWLCRECGRKFFYHSDSEDHRRHMNHSKMMLYDLAGSNKDPVPITRGRASLDFRLKGRVSKVIVEYKYYPATGAIQYIDVQYTDNKLQSMVEDDPAMMKNIDNYLRKHLRQSKPVRK